MKEELNMRNNDELTPTYVVKVLLDLKANDYRRVEKSMNVANSIYNDMLSEGKKRINKLRADENYWKLIKDYNDAKEHNEKRSKIKDKAKKTKVPVIDTKPISTSIKNMVKSYGLSQTDFEHFLRDRRHNVPCYKVLSTPEIQVISKQAFNTIKNVIYFKSKLKNLKFKSKYKDSSFKNKRNDTGLRLVDSKNDKYAYKLVLGNKHEINIKRNAFNEYQQNCMLRAEKIKYVQIQKSKIKGKFRYYLVIYLQGTPPSKHTIGNGVVGCDNGVSTLAYVSDSKLELVDLVPEKCLRMEEGIKRLQVKISRKLRLLNPECYDENNKVVKGKKMTNRSNNLIKLMNRVQKKQRKMRIYRNELQNKVCNDLLSQGNVIQLEKMNVKSLQKRSKNIRINSKTNRPYSKKRFGKSILKASPSSLITLLKSKAVSRGATIIEINTRDTKPSQYNHILNKDIKKSLNTRIYDLNNEYPNIQRDLYSAILNKYTIQQDKNGKITYTIDKARLTTEFESYYKLMQQEITKIRNENKRLSWYVS